MAVKQLPDHIKRMEKECAEIANQVISIGERAKALKKFCDNDNEVYAKLSKVRKDLLNQQYNQMIVSGYALTGYKATLDLRIELEKEIAGV